MRKGTYMAFVNGIISILSAAFVGTFSEWDHFQSTVYILVLFTALNVLSITRHILNKEDQK